MRYEEVHIHQVVFVNTQYKDNFVYVHLINIPIRSFWFSIIALVVAITKFLLEGARQLGW